MSNMKSERTSNFELMRIISMLLIIIYHVLAHGSFVEKSSSGSMYVYMFIHSLVVIGVNSFVLLTGYFQYNKHIKLTKIMALNNADWFYRVLFLCLVLFFNIEVGHDITKVEIIKSFLPIDYGIYWFINCYIILYLISPLLNKIIVVSNKRQHLVTIVTLSLIFSIVPTLTHQEVVYNLYGRSLSTFILLYFIGSYIAKYPIENDIKKLSKTAIKTISIGGYILCAVILTMCFVMSKNLTDIGSISSEIAKIFIELYFSYSSPIVIIESVFYFYIFKMMSFSNKFINKISICTIGIYLVHENIYVRENLYNYLGITKIGQFSYKHVLLLFGLALSLFVISLIVEKLRLIIFTFIYKRKISTKLRNSYQNYFKKLGLNMPW